MQTYTVTVTIRLHSGRMHTVSQWNLSLADALRMQQANEYEMGYVAIVTPN